MIREKYAYGFPVLCLLGISIGLGGLAGCEKRFATGVSNADAIRTALERIGDVERGLAETKRVVRDMERHNQPPIIPGVVKGYGTAEQKGSVKLYMPSAPPDDDE